MSRPLTVRDAARLALAVGSGAAVGALLRWGLGEAFPTAGAWPWTLWWINVAGAGLLGLLTVWAPVADRPLLATALGPGVLSGFTSVSAAAENVHTMLAEDRLLLAGAWWGSMLAASVLAVLMARQLAARSLPDRRDPSRAGAR